MDDSWIGSDDGDFRWILCALIFWMLLFGVSLFCLFWGKENNISFLVKVFYFLSSMEFLGCSILLVWVIRENKKKIEEVIGGEQFKD